MWCRDHAPGTSCHRLENGLWALPEELKANSRVEIQVEADKDGTAVVHVAAGIGASNRMADDSPVAQGNDLGMHGRPIERTVVES